MKNPTSFKRFRLVLLAVLATGLVGGHFSSFAQTKQTAAAWDRPAVATRFAAKTVLLGATQVGQRIVAVGERGIVVVSDDMARTWQQASVPVSVTLTAVMFADPKNGFAVGHAGTVLATVDGGSTWQRLLDGKKIANIELAAAKAQGDAAALKAAERLVADGADKPLLDLWVLDRQHVVVVGAYGLALESVDGGASWASWRGRLENPKELHYYAIRQRGQQMLIAGEQGMALFSQDAGQHFKRLGLPYKGSFFTAELPSDNTLLLAGLRGHAWQSEDAGAKWQVLTAPAPITFTGSHLAQDGRLTLVNQAGMVMRLVSGALLPTADKPLPPLNGVLNLSDGSLLVLSIQGAMHLAEKSPTAATK